MPRGLLATGLPWAWPQHRRPSELGSVYSDPSPAFFARGATNVMEYAAAVLSTSEVAGSRRRRAASSVVRAVCRRCRRAVSPEVPTTRGKCIFHQRCADVGAIEERAKQLAARFSPSVIRQRATARAKIARARG